MREMMPYTYQTTFLKKPIEEDCFLPMDRLPFDQKPTVGMKLRGEFGFMEITKVFHPPSTTYGAFIAKSISWEEANR